MTFDDCLLLLCQADQLAIGVPVFFLLVRQ